MGTDFFSIILLSTMKNTPLEKMGVSTSVAHKADLQLSLSFSPSPHTLFLQIWSPGHSGDSACGLHASATPEKHLVMTRNCPILSLFSWVTARWVSGKTDYDLLAEGPAVSLYHILVWFILRQKIETFGVFVWIVHQTSHSSYAGVYPCISIWNLWLYAWPKCITIHSQCSFLTLAAGWGEEQHHPGKHWTHSESLHCDCSEKEEEESPIGINRQQTTQKQTGCLFLSQFSVLKNSSAIFFWEQECQGFWFSC